MIDAHFHIWQLARGDYGWLTAAQGPIYRNVSLDDWRQARARSAVTAGILVQAAATEAETHFLLEHAQAAPDVLGVVGWVDMLALDAGQRIRNLSEDPLLRGLRPMLQGLTDPDWILQPALQPAFEAMLDCELTLDALITPVHLPRITVLAARYPDLRIVVDHGAKPDIAAGQWGEWAAGMARLAAAPQVVCKLSGLWNQAAQGAGAHELAAYAHHLLACFGAGRVLWGSDWPVLELAGTYPAWHAAARSLVPAADHPLVFELSARRAYRLPATS